MDIPDKLKNIGFAIGTLVEQGLIAFRSAKGAGATDDEAINVTSAYMLAMMRMAMEFGKEKDHG